MARHPRHGRSRGRRRCIAARRVRERHCRASHSPADIAAQQLSDGVADRSAHGPAERSPYRAAERSPHRAADGPPHGAADGASDTPRAPDRYSRASADRGAGTHDTDRARADDAAGRAADADGERRDRVRADADARHAQSDRGADPHLDAIGHRGGGRRRRGYVAPLARRSRRAGGRCGDVPRRPPSAPTGPSPRRVRRAAPAVRQARSPAVRRTLPRWLGLYVWEHRRVAYI